MQTLYLIRHGATVPDQRRPSHEWRLDPSKSEAIAQLGARLQSAGIATIYTSSEQKAIMTAQQLAPFWNAAVMPPNPGFDEQQRHSAPWFDDVADFRAAVSRLFAYPNQIVYGEESAVMALTRFRQAAAALHPSPQPIAIVTHGTVMALYIAERRGEDAAVIWQTIQAQGMPMYVRLEEAA